MYFCCLFFPFLTPLFGDNFFFLFLFLYPPLCPFCCFFALVCSLQTVTYCDHIRQIRLRFLLSPSGIHEARGPTKKIRFLRRSPLFCSSLFFKTCTMFPLKHRSSIPPSHPLSKKATKTHTSGSSRRSQLSMRAYDVQTTTDRNRIATRLRQEQEQQHHYLCKHE